MSLYGSKYAKDRRCELCGHGEPVERSSWVMCRVDEAKPVKVVWSHTCRKWIVKAVKVEAKK